MSFSIEVTVVRHTEAAVLVRDKDDEEVWIPLSQTDDDSEIYGDSKVGEKGQLVIPEWLAVKKGWL